MLLQEFDSNLKAIINPSDIVDYDPSFPETVVTCFAQTTFLRILNELPHKEIAKVSVSNLIIPIYQIIFEGKPLGFFNSYVGAPVCVSVLEDLIAMGMKNVLVFGTCGVLDSTIEETSIIIPTSALRDEGTSYHYVPASEEIPVNCNYNHVFKKFLDIKKIPYQLGKVWTTDGIYRETVDKMLDRKSRGAICVDMECSAVAALAVFRKINHFHFFYAADKLEENNWSARTLANSSDLETKDKIAYIALKFAQELFS